MPVGTEMAEHDTPNVFVKPGVVHQPIQHMLKSTAKCRLCVVWRVVEESLLGMYDSIGQGVEGHSVGDITPKFQQLLPHLLCRITVEREE